PGQDVCGRAVLIRQAHCRAGHRRPADRSGSDVLVVDQRRVDVEVAHARPSCTDVDVGVTKLLVCYRDRPRPVERLRTGHGQGDGQHSAGRAECRHLPCFQVHRRPSPPSADEPGNDAHSSDILAGYVLCPMSAVRGQYVSRFAAPNTFPAHFGTLSGVQELELLDWKRRVFGLYAGVRAAGDPEAAWHAWRDGRETLFRGHPQSPLPPEARGGFGGLAYFDYDPAFRVLGELVRGDDELRDVAASGGETVRFRRFGTVRFELV